MNSTTDFLYDLLMPEFWDQNLNSPWDDFCQAINNAWNSFCSDVDLFLKLWILIFCPSLARKLWPAKDYIRG